MNEQIGKIVYYNDFSMGRQPQISKARIENESTVADIDDAEEFDFPRSKRTDRVYKVIDLNSSGKPTDVFSWLHNSQIHPDEETCLREQGADKLRSWGIDPATLSIPAAIEVFPSASLPETKKPGSPARKREAPPILKKTASVVSESERPRHGTKTKTTNRSARSPMPLPPPKPRNTTAVEKLVANTVLAGAPFSPLDEITASRGANPPRAPHKRSFLELLNESYEAGHTIDIFFDNLLHEWGNGKTRMPPEDFCEWMAERNAGLDSVKKPGINEFAVYGWLKDKSVRAEKSPRDRRNRRNRTNFTPSAETMRKLIAAFVPNNPAINLPDAPVYLKERNFLKLARIMSGVPVNPVRTQALIKQAQRAKRHGDLFETIINDSGIPPLALGQWCGLSMGRVHSENHLRDVERVQMFISIVNPPTLELCVVPDPVILAQNKILEEMKTGRKVTLSFDAMTQKALRSSKPSVTLFNLLVGPKGKTRLSDRDMAAYFTRRLGRPYDLNAIKNRRFGPKRLLEDEAMAVIEKAGCTEDELEVSLEILTGIPSPDKMLDKVESVADPLSVKDMFRLSRDRKGMKQAQFPRYAREFENNPDYWLDWKKAAELAKRIGFEGQTSKRFLSLATGRMVSPAFSRPRRKMEKPAVHTTRVSGSPSL